MATFELVLRQLAKDKVDAFRGTIASDGRYKSRIYSSARSLSRQIAADYSSRFLIELIQNAHDAHPHDACTGRIRILLAPTEEEHGVLYVGNGGEPFEQHNVEALCDVGLSDKELSQSIGNKGLGFRSVAYVSDHPQIFSASGSPNADRYGGYCFRFAERADLADLLDEPLHLELAAKDLPPFHIPIPVQEQPHRVKTFAASGYATCIRLPLRSPAALAEAQQEITRLKHANAPVLLFLGRIAELEVEVEGDHDLTFVLTRSARDVHVKGSAIDQLSIVDLGSGGRYLLAQAAVPETEVLEAVEQSIEASYLDPAWRDWKGDGDVAVAVSLDADDVQPTLFTYLPMEVDQRAPFAGFLHGAFYTKLDRRHLDPGIPINTLYFTAALRLAVSTVVHLLAENVSKNFLVSETDLRRVVPDLLAWKDVHAQSKPVLKAADAVASALKQIGHELSDLQAIPSLDSDSLGWGSMREAWVWGETGRTWFTATRIASLAGVKLLDPSLGDARYKRLTEFMAACGWSTVPSPEETAEWVENVAIAMRARKMARREWRSYYSELPAVLPKAGKQLNRRRIVLCNDGELRMAGSASDTDAKGKRRKQATVFFPPKKGDESLIRLPKTLGKTLAFVDDKLDWYSDDMSAARAFLETNGLVRAYGAQELLEQVSRLTRVSRSPKLHSQALQWVFRLYSRAKAQRPISVKGLQLSVPSRAGWTAAPDVSFSDGWPEWTHGKVLTEFLEQAAGSESELDQLRERLLLPPTDQTFAGGSADDWAEFLRELGVGIGLQPVALEFSGSSLPGRNVTISTLAQRLSLNETVQADWKHAAQQCSANPAYRGSHHELDGTFWYWPGQSTYHNWSDETRVLYASLVLHWLPHCKDEHLRVAFFSAAARWASRFNVPTPLAAFLQEGAWLPVQSQRSLASGFDFVRAAAFWLAQEDDSDRIPVFMPAPPRLLRKVLERNPEISRALKSRCGVRTWNAIDSLPDQADDLATLLRDGAIPSHQLSAFYNTYRDTWSRVGAKISALPWESGEQHIVVRRETALEVASISELRNVDPHSVDAELVFVKDTDDVLVAEILHALGKRLFDAGQAHPEAVWRLLKGMVGSGARPTSDVALDVLLDGTRIADAAPAAPKIDETCPLISVLVLIAAESLTGAAAQALPADRRDILSRLHPIRLIVATQIALELEGERTSLPESAYGTLSVQSAGAALLVIESQHRALEWSDLVRAARPIAELLRHPALEHPLRNIFRTLEQLGVSIAQSSLGSIEVPRVAFELGMATSRAEAAIRSLGGAVDQRIRLLRPVVHYVLGETSLRAFEHDVAGVQDVAVVQRWLSLQLGESEVERIANALRDTTDFADLQEALSLDFEQFNESLEVTGERPLIYPELHRLAVDAFLQSHREEVLDQMRAPFISTFNLREPLSGYVRLRDGINSVSPPGEWLHRFRSPSSDVVKELFDEWLLQHGCKPLGSAPTGLPPVEEVRRVNRRAIDRMVDKASSIIRSWCDAHQVAAPARWDGSSLSKQALAASLHALGALDFSSLDEDGVVSWLVIAGEWPAGMPSTIELNELGLDAATLEAAKRKREAERALLEKERRSFVFGGQLLDPDECDVHALNDMIGKSVQTDDALPTFGMTINLEPYSSEPGRRWKGGGGSAPRPRTRIHPTKAEFIGLVGECAVYHWLKKKFPNKDIDAAWVSTLRCKVLVGDGDDSLGYDFRLPYRNRTWYVEVKTHAGDPQEIELGETEVKMASECVRSTTKEYIIAYVSHAEDPERLQIEQLQNPLIGREKSGFRLVGEGLRYRFSRE